MEERRERVNMKTEREARLEKGCRGKRCKEREQNDVQRKDAQRLTASPSLKKKRFSSTANRTPKLGEFAACCPHTYAHPFTETAIACKVHADIWTRRRMMEKRKGEGEKKEKKSAKSRKRFVITGS